MQAKVEPMAARGAACSTPIRIMGIVNVTPDSFSDGGRFFDTATAIDHAMALVEQGAHIIDIGGESTRPGSQAIAVGEELDRVIPVVEGIRSRSDVVVSIDTSKAAVMRAAVVAGAGFVNDVRALREPGALEAASELQVPVCLMHMQGEPRTMQEAPHYDDVVQEVGDFLAARANECVQNGMDHGAIYLDPGFGFGKTLEHNLTLLRELDQLVNRGWPVLVGMSRKRMIGALLGDTDKDRTVGSVALAMLAAVRGAAILRVHDVQQTMDALRVCAAVGDLDLAR